jgi:two-component system phosphate regulon sensor histidine kinase PhoR
VLLEESRELVIVLDDRNRVVAASRRAREAIDGLREGRPLPPEILHDEDVLEVPYEIDGRRERLVYLRGAGDAAAYEELRAGFTAAVSHELRTPLARLMSRLETAMLPSEDPRTHIEQARADLEQIRELIDDVLFLSELETGRAVVALGAAPVLPILEQVAHDVRERAVRAAVTIHVQGDPALELPVRPRMLRVIAHNLTENAIRYAGPGATFTLAVRRENGEVALVGSDDGVGVLDRDVPRLFERFYRSDRARASRGTGLGLAIVKHIVNAAGGRVEAFGARGRGLEVRCVFPEPR